MGMACTTRRRAATERDGVAAPPEPSSYFDETEKPECRRWGFLRAAGNRLNSLSTGALGLQSQAYVKLTLRSSRAQHPNFTPKGLLSRNRDKLTSRLDARQLLGAQGRVS